MRGDEGLGAWRFAADVVLARVGRDVDGGEDYAEGEDDQDDQGGEDAHLVGADEAAGALEESGNGGVGGEGVCVCVLCFLFGVRKNYYKNMLLY